MTTKSALDLAVEKFGNYLFRESEYEFVFRCPNCSRQLRFNIVVGLFNCFSCGYGKGQRIYSSQPTNIFPAKKDPQLINEITKYILETSNLRDSDINYLKGRGIYQPYDLGFRSIPLFLMLELIDNFGEKRLEEAKIIRSEKNGYSLTTSLQFNRVFFPYWISENNYIGFKTRDTQINTSVRYAMPYGSKCTNYLFRPKGFKISSEIFVTEGEFGAIVAQSFGLNCVSIPGIAITDNCYKEYISLINNSKVKRVFLVLDNQSNLATHKNLLSAFCKLGRNPKVTQVLLPLYGQDKQDLDSFLLTNSIDDFEYICNSSLTNRKLIYQQLLQNLYAL